MALQAGIFTQLGFKSESTHGTAVTPDLFHCGFLSESIEAEHQRLPSSGLRANRRVGQSSWKSGGTSISGSVEVELFSQPLASLLTHMFGTVNTTGAGPYTHTATPGSLTGKSMTVQVGGDELQKTYAGVKIPSWRISSRVGELAMLNLDLTAKTQALDTGLAAASYPTAEPFTFVEGSVTIGGSAYANVTSFELEADNALDSERWEVGSASIREQLETGFRAYTGTIEADFVDLTAYNRVVDGDEAAVVLTLDNGTDSLVITMNCRFDGTTPTIGGPELVAQNLDFVALDATSDASAITAVLINGEASAA